MPLTRRKIDGTAARGLVERSRNAQLTYAPVGISLGWEPSTHGFRDHSTEQVIGHGPEAFAKAGYALMHWEINRKAGFQVQPEHDQVRVGERVGVVMPLLGIFGVSAICEVVAVVAVGDSIGFAYGSLPKHPMTGEESFVLSLQDNGDVVMTVRSVSRPAAWFTKLGAPLARLKQSGATKKYLAAARFYAEAPAPDHAEP